MASIMKRTIGLFKSACCRHSRQLEWEVERDADADVEGAEEFVGGGGADVMQSKCEKEENWQKEGVGGVAAVLAATQ